MVLFTYRRGFFLGPGFPRGLGMPSFEPDALGALRLTPFFLRPSGGPIEEAGVPSGAGVAALESEPLSPLGATWSVAEVAGESFASLESVTGDSSFTTSGSRTSRNRADGTERLTRRLGLLPPDLRRPSVFADGGMAATNAVR